MIFLINLITRQNSINRLDYILIKFLTISFSYEAFSSQIYLTLYSILLEFDRSNCENTTPVITVPEWWRGWWMTWNTRGMNRMKRKRELLALMHRELLIIVGVLETKIEVRKQDETRNFFERQWGTIFITFRPAEIEEQEDLSCVHNYNKIKCE